MPHRVHRGRPALTTALVTALVFLLLIPGVSSAEVIIDETLHYSEDTSLTYDGYSLSTTSYTNREYSHILIKNIQDHQHVSYIGFVMPGDTKPGNMVEGTNALTYTLNGQTRPCNVFYTYSRDYLGTITSTNILIFFDDWDIGSITGSVAVPFSEPLITGVKEASANSLNQEFRFQLSATLNSAAPKSCLSSVMASYVEVKNHLRIESTDLYYTMHLTRQIDGLVNPSRIEVLKNSTVLFFNEDTKDIDLAYLHSQTDEVVIMVSSQTYRYPLGSSSGGPSDASVTVYIQNSQTGALLANANLAILTSAGGTETEIINTTLPGGTATYTLQPTGGGSPNPDYYRAVATVPGFTQIIENHSFTLNGPHDVIIEMRPDSGGPLDPERAYLEFYVRDLNANPIPAASIQCGGRILQTNSAGYAVFEVAKNASHPWIAKKSGYVTIEGTATVADGPRYVVNVVLGPGTVPTHTPTLGPGETPGGPGATPTPDTRTNEQKGQAIIDLIADFAEPIALLAIVATVFGLMQMMMPRRR